MGREGQAQVEREEVLLPADNRCERQYLEGKTLHTGDPKPAKPDTMWTLNVQACLVDREILQALSINLKR